MTTTRAEYFDERSEVLQRQIHLTETVLEDGLSFTKDHKAELAVLSVPQNFQVINSDTSTDLSYVDRRFEQFAADRGFAWLSSLPFMKAAYLKDREDLYYRLDGHLNKKGNETLAAFATAKLPALTRSLRSQAYNNAGHSPAGAITSNAPDAR